MPWGDLVFEGELKTTDELRAIFERQGVDLHRPVIASCGSGVTACVVIPALATLGANDVTLYDGAQVNGVHGTICRLNRRNNG